MPLASDIYSSLAKPHSRQLSIPPPPRSQPPSPPKASPPPFASNAVVSGLDLGFPSPPTLAHYIHPSSAERPKILSIPLSSPSNRQLPHLPTPPEIFPLQVHKPSSAGSGCSDVPAARPPAVPPRSKLRPPPVKITTDFRRTLATASPASDRASPAHSFSSSVESLTISPLASPPLHSQSSSIASSIMSSSPTSPQPSPSPSIASSFVISPMPTPPLLSPTSPVPTSPGSNPPPLAIPRIRPVTPEPQIDMGLLRTLLMQRKRSESYDGCESEVGESLEASVAESDTAESSTCITTVPEFAWQEEPRSPPSRMSFCESLERNNPSSDIEDDDAVSIYSQFSAAYTFRSRSIRGRNGRLSRRTTAVSMMSLYSQASISPQDAMDLPPIPALPWDLKGDLFPEETVADSDLGEMTFNAPEYAYAYSLDDYVGHGLEGAALAGRTASRSGADFEAELPTSHMKTSESSNRSASDDWRAFLTAKVDVKRRTSSNISVVGVVPPVQDPEVTTGLTFTNRGSKTTNRGIGGVSTASNLTPRSPRTLAPNRRQKTIRRATSRPPSLPRSNCRPASPRYVVEAGTGAGDWRRETSSADSVPFSSLGLADRTKKPHGMRSGLRDVRSRVSGLKSRLVSLTISSPRSSPSSPSFTPAPSPNFYHHRPGHAPSPPSPLNRPPASSPWPVSPSVSSYSASGKSDVSLPRGPSDSSWNLGRTHGDGLSFSPTATPSTFPITI
ncbi:hypothetical protein B0H11DRAFT_1102799 [Mycena galericulata]|nr:hypothetical protein B0H11DRAFT_1102799 [Mycena galericulata]